MHPCDRDFQHPLYHGHIALTFDVDWANERMLTHVRGLVEDAGLKATFFATHDSEVIRGLDRDRYEVGIHPNFRGNMEYDARTADLRSLYPDAVGVRSHGLFTGSDINRAFVRAGIRYDSNIFLPYMNYVKPYMHCCGLYMIPYVWDDDFTIGSGLGFESLHMDLGKPGIKIFNFHPVHVYYNTPTPEYYQGIKDRGYPDAGSVAKPAKGAGSLFDLLVSHIQRQGLKTILMREIYERRDELGESGSKPCGEAGDL